MCESREEAELRCLKIYKHANLGKPDVGRDGLPYRDACFYAAPENLEWIVMPDDEDPGVLGVIRGIVPLCQQGLPITERELKQQTRTSARKRK